MDKPYLTVGALTKYIKYKFDHDAHLLRVFLKGEVSNFKRHSRGHFYFTLKDEQAQISAVMFSSHAGKVKFVPKDGMTVKVEGKVTVYEPSGSYVIHVDDLSEDGLGNLFVAYEQLKAELEAAGYFLPIHKKRLPKYPQTIGVITSPTGAAIKDIIHTINRRYPICKVLIYPALVQGEGAKQSIVENIQLANEQKRCDVLIVGRGGGSIEDLWAFNERIVIDAIFQSNIPIISAVGHETDFTLADFVSDMRAPTPTAAAELATPDIKALLEFVKQQTYLLNQGLKGWFRERQMKLMYLDQRLSGLNPERKLNELKEAHERHRLRLNQNMHRILEIKQHRFDLLIQKLEVLNPLSMMDRGYSVSEVDGKVIRTIDDVQENDTITLHVIDGNITSTVVKKERVSPYGRNKTKL